MRESPPPSPRAGSRPRPAGTPPSLPGPRPSPPILDFCNAPLGTENWRAACLDLLRREGMLPYSPKGLKEPKEEGEPLTQLTFNGAKVTYGNVEFLRDRFRQVLGEVAEGGKFAPRHIEVLNAALTQARGTRFRLERQFSPARAEEDTVFFRPLTFELDFLLHFAVGRFLSGLDPRRLKKCPHCARLFLLEARHRKRFCTDSCRTGFHNRERVESGRQALYMRRRREAIRQKSAPLPPET